MRSTFEIRQKLEQAAAESGRSLAQEAEFRIDRSFVEQQLLIEALEMAYGPELSGVLLVLGETMAIAGRQAAFMKSLGDKRAENWSQSPYAFSQIVQAADRVFEAIKPDGDSSPPRLGKTEAIDLDQIAKNFGRGIADGILAEIASNEPTTSTAITRAPRLRRFLGEVLVDRVKRFTRKQS